MNPNAHQYLRFFLEMLFFVSGIILAGVGVTALYQIVLAKRSIETARSDIELRSKREAVTLAADRCAVFATVTHRECKDSLNKIANAGVTIRNWTLENNAFEKSSIKDWEEAKQWLKQLQPEQLNDAGKILNLLESFAMYFAEGAADETVAYSSVGPIFCSYVNRLAPYLILLRAKEATVASGSFENITKLYDVWASRLKRHALESERKGIDLELSSLWPSEIKPIGTKRDQL